MARSYYVQTEGGAVRGPLSADEVRAEAAKGELQPQDFIRDAAHPGWRPLASVAGLTFGPPSGRDDEPITLRDSVAPIVGGVKAVGRTAARLFGHSGSISEAARQSAEHGSHGAVGFQVAARSFDSPEEAQEAALRTLASLRAQGQITEGEYQERRRQIIGVSPAPTFDPEVTAGCGYERQRVGARKTGSTEQYQEEHPKRRINPLLAVLLGVIGCWVAYSYVVETGPFAKKAAEPTRPAPQTRAPAVATPPPQVDVRSGFLKFANCIGGQLVDNSVKIQGWWIDPSSVSFDLRQTASLLNPVEGVISCEVRSVAQGRYIATIRFAQRDSAWRADGFELRFNGSDRRDNHLDAARQLLNQWLKAVDYDHCPHDPRCN